MALKGTNVLLKVSEVRADITYDVYDDTTFIQKRTIPSIQNSITAGNETANITLLVERDLTSIEKLLAAREAAIIKVGALSATTISEILLPPVPDAPILSETDGIVTIITTGTDVNIIINNSVPEEIIKINQLSMTYDLSAMPADTYDVIITPRNHVHKSGTSSNIAVVIG
tara:strand:- start:7519 stop:8031 length:513 start_codon:yes stop_codon:yes gene_type:complete